MKNLIWITSYPKSGNTWVRAIIYAGLIGKVDLNDFAKVVPAFNAMGMTGSNVRDAGNIDEQVLHWDAAQKLASGHASPKAQFFKTHNAAATVNDVEFPSRDYTARAVYIVRDPRDVALSFSRHYDCDINETIGTMLDDSFCSFDAHQSEFLSSWRNHMVSWNAKAFPVLFLRYEDLLKDPTSQIGRLFKFLGIRSKLPARELVEITAFEKLKAKEQQQGFVESVKGRQFFWRGESGLGKSFIGADFKKLEADCSDIMKRFGYL